MSTLREKIERRKRETELFILIEAALAANPVLVEEFYEVLDELSGKNTQKINEKDDNSPPAENDKKETPNIPEIRKGTDSFKEYKMKVGAVIAEALRPFAPRGVNSTGVYNKIKGKANLRIENDNPKGLGKLLPLLVNDDVIKRFQKSGVWYYYMPKDENDDE